MHYGVCLKVSSSEPYSFQEEWSWVDPSVTMRHKSDGPTLIQPLWKWQEGDTSQNIKTNEGSQINLLRK